MSDSIPLLQRSAAARAALDRDRIVAEVEALQALEQKAFTSAT